METIRTTLYLERDLHRMLRLRSAASEHSLSRIVNEAVRRALAEDAADLDALRRCSGEKCVDFGVFLRGLKRVRRGRAWRPQR